jgi:hypothetical protein
MIDLHGKGKLKFLFWSRWVYRLWYFFLRYKPHKSKKISEEKNRNFCWGDSLKDYSGKEIPRIVWTYWEGESSHVVAACFKSWELHLKGFSLIQVTPSNLSHYLPEFPVLDSGIPAQKVSNLVRLMLLEKYGGIWMDASVVVAKSIDWVLEVFIKENVEALLFYNEFYDEYRSDHDCPIVENGFIAARVNSDFISNWKNNYLDCLVSGDYQNYYKKLPEYGMLIKNFVDAKGIEYFVCYLAAQKTMRDSKSYRLCLVNAEDDYYYHYYHTFPPRNRRKFAEWLLLIPDVEDGKSLIKITGSHRHKLEELISYGCFRKNSILGRHLGRI